MAAPTGYEWDVFLSHNSKDKRRVRRLHRELTDRGVRVWLDETAILAGASIPLAVEDGIERSRTVALCLSPAFLASEWTAFERSAFQFADPANARRTIIPVLFSDCELPKALRHLKRIDYTRHSSAAIEELIASIGVNEAAVVTVPTSEVETRLEVAKTQAYAGAYAEALVAAREVIDLCESESGEHRNGLARARAACAHYLLAMQGDLDEMWRLITYAADALDEDFENDFWISTLITKAEVAIASGRLLAADSAIRGAAEIAETEGDEGDRRALLQVRAQLAARAGRAEEALALWDEALGEFQAMLSTAPAGDRPLAMRGVATCLNNKALMLRLEGRTADAIRMLSQAADAFSAAGDPFGEASSRVVLAGGYFHSGLEALGWDSLEQASRLAREHGYQACALDCIELEGRARATSGETVYAEELFRAGLEIATEIESPHDQLRFHWKLAILARQGARFADAEEHLRSALSLASQIPDTEQAAELSVELAALSSKPGEQIDRATLIAELEDRIRRTEVPAQAAFLMGPVGAEHRAAGGLERALEWFSKALEAHTALGDVVGAARSAAALGETEVALGRHAEAMTHLQLALGHAAGRAVWDVEVSARVRMAEIYEHRGAFRDARELLKEALQLAEAHHLDDFTDVLPHLLNRLERFLALQGVPESSLEELLEECDALVKWFPSAAGSLLRFWYYWRQVPLLASVRSQVASKVIFVSNDPGELAGLFNDFAVLFDIPLFAAETSFANEPKIDLTPFPLDWPFPECVSVITARRPDSPDDGDEPF